MGLLEDLFSFVSRKRFLTQKLQESQALKAFILEPILTPSGLVDDLTHDTGLIIIDPNPGIDHSLDFPSDAHPELDHAPVVDLHLSTAAIPPEHIELLPFIPDPEPTIPSVEHLFDSGIFTVGASGKVSIDYLFDGGGYQGQLAIFNLKGMEEFDLNTETGLADFIHEAAHRALSNSDLGHVVIADATEGAKFSGLMPSEWQDRNFGQYQGVKTFDMEVGDKFAVMLVPNGTVQQVLDGNQDADIRPLFSLHTVNPNEAFHVGQIADVTGDGNTFVLEDLRTDHWTDRDYNDIIFQVRGATGTAAHLDDVINPELDWRHSDVGQELIAYAHAQIEPVNPHPTLPEVPVVNHPLIGIIDTGFSGNNPDINYSHIILGHDYVDGDSNPLLPSGVGNEHGTHVLGIIGATQNNGVGIDGINDDAPIWVSRAVGSGHWSDSLVEFVDAAKASHQPNAVVNLSLDLTQINHDGSITTRYEFTPLERAAIEYARQNHVLIVAAAGNDGGVMSVLGQASQEFDNIITVGAADGLERAEYSSYGSGLDILAPGGTSENPILSAVGDGVGTMAGTSVAAAEVTGAISQVWAANPDLSYRQVIEILKSTATDLDTPGWDAETGSGLLNLVAAVSVARTVVPENFIPLPWITPETWSGAGVVTPEERAASGGNSIVTAPIYALPQISDKDTVSPTQPEKYYGFKVNEPGYMHWTITRINGSQNLPNASVIKADGSPASFQFLSGVSSGGASGAVSIGVDGSSGSSPISTEGKAFFEPGTYYLKVASGPLPGIKSYELATEFVPDSPSNFAGAYQFITPDPNKYWDVFSGTVAPQLNVYGTLNAEGTPAQRTARYGLEVNESGKLAINVQSGQGVIPLYVRKFIGTSDRYEDIAYELIGDTANKTIELNLNKGRYQLFVNSDWDNIPLHPFSLNASFIPNDADGSMLGAKNIGRPTSAYNTYSDSVGGSDKNDYYRFELNQDSWLTLKLIGKSGDANLDILDASGNTVYQSRSIGNNLVYEQLKAGTYYIKVFPANSYDNTAYDLKVAADPVNISPQSSSSGSSSVSIGEAPASNTGSSSVSIGEAPLSNAGSSSSVSIGATPASNASGTSSVFQDTDGSFLTAQLISNQWGGTSLDNKISGSVSGADKYDYYRFELREPSIVTAQLTSLSGDAIISILKDTNNNQVDDYGDWLYGANKAPSPIMLDPGTYYIRVAQLADNAQNDYSLKLSTQPINSNANGSASSSGSSSSSVSVGGSSPSQTVAPLPGQGGVPANAGNLVNISSSSGVTTYYYSNGYLSVQPSGYQTWYYSGSGTSSTILNTTPIPVPADYAGNTSSAARNIGLLLGSVSPISDFVGSVDPIDFYRFNLDRRSDFNLLLNGLTGDADVRLIRDENNNGQVDSGDKLAGLSQNNSNLPESIATTLEPGNYFVKIESKVSDTNYKLNLSAQQTNSSVNSSVSIGSGTSSGGTTQSSPVNTTNNLTIYPANHKGLVTPSIGVQWRNSPKVNDRNPNNATAYGSWLSFDGLTYGESINDYQTGVQDNIWWRIAGTNYWVPSAYIANEQPITNNTSNSGSTNSSNNSVGGTTSAIFQEPSNNQPQWQVTIGTIGSSSSSNSVTTGNAIKIISPGHTTSTINFDLKNQSIWNGGQGSSIGGSIPGGINREWPFDLAKVSLKAGYTFSAFASLGTFGVNIPTAFDINWQPNQDGKSVAVNFSSKLNSGLSIETLFGLDLSAKLNLGAELSTTLPAPWLNTTIGFEASGGIDLNSIMKAAGSPVVLDLSLEAKKKNDNLNNSVEAEDVAFEAIDVINTLKLIPYTSAAATAVQEAGVGASLGVNIQQKSKFDVTGFEIDYDGQKNGNELILDINGSGMLNVPIPDWLKAGEEFKFTPTIKPLANFQSFFNLGGKIEGSLELINLADKLPIPGWLKETLPSVSLKESLETPYLSVWQGKSFNPFDFTSAFKLSEINVQTS